MRFHWYWPFARREELDWAIATARHAETVLVEVIDRAEAPAGGVHGPVTVIRDLDDVDRRTGSTVKWLASRSRTYSRRSRTRRRHWQIEQFDLVHLHYLNRFTDTFARLPHPLVMSVHDVVPHMPRLGRRVEHHLLAHLYSRSDALVVHHRRLADELVTNFELVASRIHVLPHQVFPVGDVPQPAAEPAVILFFGALRPNKGLGVLLAALDHLHGDDVRLIIAGRGDADLEALAHQAAIDDPRVTAEIGFATLERKRELFGLASVVVLPYTSFASQSGVLHDAYGHGRPVVVSDLGALGDTVREDETGVVVSPCDPRALADAIRRATSSQEWSAFSSNARRIAQERSPLAVGVHLRAIYDDVLDSF